ncbi:MAG: rhomboid family intramembrane serine protease [Proteobacteria bacterium]|nr:rhomboid family intramembrane serine protease [Pseudomonadota bacterium]
MTQSSDVKICHACQAELAIGQKRCPYCHARQMTAAEVRIGRVFKAVMPRVYPATKVLLFLIVVYFIFISVVIFRLPDFGLKEVLFNPPGEVIYRWGGHLRGEFVWWRMITANFLHFGLIHILFNGMALRYVTPYVERAYGAALTLVYFVVFGAVSMIVSNLVGGTGVVAGASGALMGFIGLAAVSAHREGTSLSKQVRNSMIKWAVFTMVFGIVVSLSGSMGIDNIAHASGLAVGVLAGFVLPAQSTTGYTKLWIIRLAGFLAFLAVVGTGFAFYTMATSVSSLRSQQECGTLMRLKKFEEAEQACAEAYRNDKTREITYRNYIVISVIRGNNERAAALCAEGKARFADKKDKIDFDELCRSIGVP